MDRLAEILRRLEFTMETLNQPETNVLLVELSEEVGVVHAHALASRIFRNLSATAREWWEAPQPAGSDMLTDGMDAALRVLERRQRK